MSSDDGMDWLELEGGGAPIDQGELALESVGRAAQLNLYNVVRATFERCAAKDGLTRREIADRLGVPPAQVSRLLVRPTNMTIETAARLMFVMGEELQIFCRSADVSPSAQAMHARWDYEPAQIATSSWLTWIEARRVMDAKNLYFTHYATVASIEELQANMVETSTHYEIPGWRPAGAASGPRSSVGWPTPLPYRELKHA